uniref:Reverse transcriptase domain-containing protein n=1 Tax=Loa loa TaxID=7209 RepID=A0A1I7VW03_LOALO
MITIENIERVLRQLEALGDNLEHPSIETIIESKMPPWILNKKLPIGFGGMNQQVKIDQYSNFRADNKPTTIKGSKNECIGLKELQPYQRCKQTIEKQEAQQAGRDRAYFAHVITGIVIVISIQ